MPVFVYDQTGVSSTLEFGNGGGRIVWDTDHFESTSDGSTLAQLRVPTTPIVGNDAASKAYVDGAVTPTASIPAIALFYPSQPNANEPLLTYTFDRSLDFPDDFAGSVGTVGSNPAATYNMLIQRNGVNIGSISVSTAGVYTFATTGAGLESFVSGDTLTILAPGATDATIGDFSITIRGS